MRLTKEQLIATANAAAKYLPAASADIMKELAYRLDITSVALSEALEHRNNLAAENMMLKTPETWMAESDYGYEARELALNEGATEQEALLAGVQGIIDAIKTPATKKWINDFLNQARKEGAIFAANRMLAAWDAGFVEDTPENAADIARAILTSTEFMDDAPEGDFSRAFADEMLKAIAHQLREGK